MLHEEHLQNVQWCVAWLALHHDAHSATLESCACAASHGSPSDKDGIVRGRAGSTSQAGRSDDGRTADVALTMTAVDAAALWKAGMRRAWALSG